MISHFIPDHQWSSDSCWGSCSLQHCCTACAASSHAHGFPGVALPLASVLFPGSHSFCVSAANPSSALICPYLILPSCAFIKILLKGVSFAWNHFEIKMVKKKKERLTTAQLMVHHVPKLNKHFEKRKIKINQENTMVYSNSEALIYFNKISSH